MPDRFFNRMFHKSLVGVVVTACFCLSLDVYTAGLKSPSAGNLVYANDDSADGQT
jgi:hypothetical protein